MPVDLQRKVGPLPLWGWVLVTGGGIGAIILVRKSKGAKGEPTEPAAVLSGQSAPAGESGVGSGGGAGSEITKTPGPELIPPTIEPTSPTYEIGGFPGEVRDVGEGLAALRDLGLVPPAPAATSSTAGAAAQQRHKATGGNPRAGMKFKPGTYHGQAAHIYPHAVPGGVGKGKNVILLPIGKKNHAAKGHHEPAHAKAKPHHHRPAPKHRPKTHHPTKGRR